MYQLLKALSAVALLALLGTSGAKAQSFTIVPYTQDHGLPTNITKTIAQDGLGFIWVGTDMGLARFDGKNFLPLEAGLPSPYVKSLFKIPDGNLLAVTDLGIVEIISRPDTAYAKPYPVPAPKDFQPQYPKDVYIDCQGRIWICEDSHLLSLSGQTWKRYPIAGAENGGTFWRSIMVYEEGCGQLVALAPDGKMHAYNPQLDVFEPLAMKASANIGLAALEGVRFQTMSRHGRSDLAVGTNQGVFVFQINWPERTAQITHQFVKGLSVRHLTWSGLGGIYVGTEREGLYRIDNVEHGALKRIPNIPFAAINYIFEDHDHNLWASGDVGIALVKPSMFVAVEAPAQVGEYYMAGDEDALYAISKQGEMYEVALKEGMPAFSFVKKHDFFTRLHTGGSLDVPAQVSILNKNVLIANEKSKQLYYAGEYGHRIFDTELPTNPMQAMLDRKGNSWAVTSTGNVVRVDAQSGKVSQYNFEPEKFMTLAETYDGEIYALGRFFNNYLHRYYASSDGFENRSVPIKFLEEGNLPFLAFDVEKDTTGALWLAANYGLFRIYKGEIEQIDLGKGYNQYIKSIAIDNFGAVWLATNTALICYKDGEPHIFTEQDGLPISNIQFDGLHLSEDGTLWVSTQSGLVFSRIQLQEQKATPSPLLISAIADGRKIPLPGPAETMHLPYHAYFKATLATPSYPSEKIRYRYRIYEAGNAKNEHHWTLLPLNEPLLLTQLPAGDLVLEIEARQDGVYQWSAPIAVHLRIDTPWFLKWWSIFGGLLALAAIIWTSLRLYTVSLRQQKFTLEQLVAQRTAEILAQKAEIEEQRNMLRENRDELSELNDRLNMSNEELHTTIEVINGQKRAIELQHHEMRASISYASRIQQSILPSSKRMNDLIGEHFVYYQPKDIVSGDFYWCDTVLQRVVLAVGDCTGHGVPGALMSMIADGLLNQAVLKDRLIDPAMVIRHVDNGLREILGQASMKNSTSLEGMDIGLCTLDKSSRKMYFAGAKLSLVSIKNKEIRIIKADNVSVGSTRIDYQFKQHELPLEKGTCYYLFSDGFKDQFGGEDGKKFMGKRFAQLLADISHLHMHEQKKALEQTLNEWMQASLQEQEQIDDILVLGFRG